MSMNDGARGIELVREGMHVYDSAGVEIGTVEYVRMGDPAAVTTRGNETEVGGFIRGIADTIVGSEPDVPQPLKDRLARTGFVKIDGPGLADTDRYVSADRIASVDGDRVTLGVTKDQLPVEE
jgi:hypothetical protein